MPLSSSSLPAGLRDSSIPAALREQVRRQPDAPAFTFIDYELDPAAGYSETLAWSEVHQRVQVVAAELASCGSPGDRVAILAPQAGSPPAVIEIDALDLDTSADSCPGGSGWTIASIVLDSIGLDTA